MMHPVNIQNNIQKERSLGELLSDLAQETSTLVRQEVQLAKAEMTGKAKLVSKDALMIGAGGALAYAGLLALLAAVTLLLAHVIPLWLSALLVGLAAAGGGYVMVKQGLDRLKHLEAAPRQTVQTLKEDKLWLSEQVR